MIYNPPKVDGKEVWVPIVAKNKDWLVGYIRGIHFMQDCTDGLMEELDVDMHFEMFGVGLDSSRFNDILPNDKRMSKLTKKEAKKFFSDIEKHLEAKEEILDNPDDEDVELEDTFLVIDCPCDMGFYSFRDEKDVPPVDVNCQICGRPLIHYTGIDDLEFEYDGED